MNELRPIDYNGHVPDLEEDPAAKLLAIMQDSQEHVYRMAEGLGISRAELNERAGVQAA